MKKSALAVLAVFVAWSVMDFVIHGMILQSAYAATASLWRPMDEMKTSLMYFTVLISALTFVLIYSLLCSRKGISTGLTYGLLFGLSTGVPMGYGSISWRSFGASALFLRPRWEVSLSARSFGTEAG
jgi:hypothetical protein